MGFPAMGNCFTAGHSQEEDCRGKSGTQLPGAGRGGEVSPLSQGHWLSLSMHLGTWFASDSPFCRSVKMGLREPPLPLLFPSRDRPQKWRAQSSGPMALPDRRWTQMSCSLGPRKEVATAA